MVTRMMRILAVLLLTTAPALAWEAKSGRLCELTYDGADVSVRVTYDPAIPEYSIAVTSQSRWPNDPIFAMRFDGPQGNTITTNRQVISPDGTTVTVTDSGFGNVLNGLEFNQTATALLGDRAVAVPLDDAAPAVRAFRACASGLNA